MRRLISSFLVIMVCTAIFLFPLSAVEPTNNVLLDVQVFEYLTLYGREEPFLMPFDLSTGSTMMYGVRGIDRDSGSNEVFVNMDKSYNSVHFALGGTSTMWIAVRTAALSSYSFTGLESYRYSSGDLTHTYSNISYPRYNCYWESGEIVNFGNGTSNFDVTFLCFKDVPSSQSFSYYDYSTGSDSSSFIYRVVGFYFNHSGGLIVSDLVNSYISGSTSFSDAVTSIRETTDSNVSASSSVDEKLFHLLNAEYALDQLLVASDDKALQKLHDSFIPLLDKQISNFKGGAQSLSVTLTKFSNSYSNALNSAETADQGNLISAAYSFKLEQLRLTAENLAGERLDSAISDAEMSEVSDYYAAEDDLLAKFDIQKFKDALTFDLWFQQLDLVESNLYKSVFDRIINESNIRFYVSIPLALLIVSILLGTALRTNRRV